MKNIVLIVVGILAGSLLFAQSQGDDVEEKYYAQKIAYLTTEMDLSSDESAAFWPLYNEHEKKQKALRIEKKTFHKKMHENEAELSEEESKQALEFFQKHMTLINNLEIEYQNKYLEVISAKKVLLMLKAEKEFRRNLLRKLGDRRQHRNRN